MIFISFPHSFSLPVSLTYARTSIHCPCIPIKFSFYFIQMFDNCICFCCHVAPTTSSSSVSVIIVFIILSLNIEVIFDYPLTIQTMNRVCVWVSEWVWLFIYPIRKWDEFHVMWCKFALLFWTCEQNVKYTHAPADRRRQEKSGTLVLSITLFVRNSRAMSEYAQHISPFFVIARTKRHRSEFRWSWLIFLLCFTRSTLVRARVCADWFCYSIFTFFVAVARARAHPCSHCLRCFLCLVF